MTDTLELEAQKHTSGLTAAQLEKLYDESLKEFNEGSIIEGVVIAIRASDVLVDVGYKSEGMIPKHEFKKLDELSVGDKIEVLLERLEDDNGMVVLSKQRAELQKNWDRILDSYSEGDIIEGVIHGRVKGGMLVDVGVEAFLPGSQIDLVPVKNPDDFIGQVVQVKIIKINLERRNIVVSRRELMEEQRREMRSQLLSEIKIGQQRKGTVKNITDFGAFIDLNGMDGLLHITDMSWGRVNHPSEIVKINQSIEVVVLDYDAERGRISLGLKQKTRNPWEDIENRYPPKSIHKGEVVNLMNYGAFVKLEDGIEGLVHVSEMTWGKQPTHPSEIFKQGDPVNVMVLEINHEKQEISLGIKQAEKNPWDNITSRYSIGTKVKGPVTSITNYGAFVELEEGIEGLLHVNDISWTKKLTHPSPELKKDDVVECIVLGVDEERQRISLGKKQLEADPWEEEIPNKVKKGDTLGGKVAKITNFGVFVEILDGIEGLLHVSELPDDLAADPENKLTIGQDIEVKVINIDYQERKIGLTMKA